MSERPKNVTHTDFEILIELANSGNVQLARDLIGSLAQYVNQDESLPQELKEYFFPRLFELSENPESDANKVLNLTRRPGPQKRPDEELQELVNKVIECVEEKHDRTEDEAFSILSASEENPSNYKGDSGSIALSKERIRDLFYAGLVEPPFGARLSYILKYHPKILADLGFPSGYSQSIASLQDVIRQHPQLTEDAYRKAFPHRMDEL